MDFLNVARETVLCLHANTRVERLCIAEQGSDFAGGPKPGYLALLKAHSECRLNAMYPMGSSCRLVYVSRSNLPHGGNFLGERYLQTHLAEEGFEIFHPEDHDLSWQMEVYRSADIIVFPEGSACHGTELLGSGMLRTSVFLERRMSHRRVFHNVLRPRSERFIALDGFKQIGSVTKNPITGVSLEHNSVWAFEPDHLVEPLRQNGIARLPNFTRAAYLEACRQDLEEYFMQFRGSGARNPGDAVFAGLSENLDTIR